MFLFHYNTEILIFQYLYVFFHKIHKQISTNIKTSLQAVTVAVDSIRSISAGAHIGADGLFDTTTLATYKQQLEGLTVTQQKMALMTTNLTAAQREQVLSYIASTTATKTLTAEQVLSCTADEKRILVKAGLIAEEELEKGAVINLTQEKLKEILADETLNATEKNTILTKFGVTGANLTEASSWEVLGKSIGKATIAMMKWLFLTPAGWATLAIGGVVGLISAYAKWGSTLENTREKLEDLKSECDTIASDLSSVNSELKTTKQRMDELEGKGTLTFTEKEEYDNLVKTNNELQRKIDLLELEQKTKNKEKNKTFVETMEKDIYSTDYYRDGLDDGKIKKGQAGRSEHRTTTTEQAYIIQQFNDREKLLDDLAKAKTEAERKRIQEQIDEIDKYLSDRNEQFKSDADGIEYIQNPTTDDEKAVNAWLDYINDFQDRMAITMGGDNAKTNAFNRVVDNWQFDDTVQELQDLGKQGKVTAKMLDDPKYDAFIQKLYELGVIDSVDNLDAVALAFNNAGTEAKAAGENANKMTVSLSDLEKASDNISKLSSAFKELSEDGYITTKTLGEIKTATGLAEDEWAKYEQKLLTAKAGSAEFNQVMSELTYKMLDAKFGTIDLTNATEEEISAIETKIAATLRERGVTNASAVAHDYVARAKEKARIKTKLLAGATYEEVVALSAEAAQAGITGKEFIDLVIDIGVLNNTSLDPQQKIRALQEIGFYADWTAKKISEVGKVSRFSSNGKDGLSVYDKDGKLIDVKIFDDYTPPKYEPPEIPDFSGTLKDPKDSKDKTPFDDSYYSEVDSWLKENEKEIEHLEKEFKSLNRQFENALETGDKDRIKILRKKLAENAKSQKDLLHSQNEAHRITQGELLQSLYQITPSLKGKSWDEISDVDLQRIENKLNKEAELAVDDNTKNQAKSKLNQFKGVVDDLSAIGDAIKENSEVWWDADEKIADSWRSTIDARTENSEDWISVQKDLNNLTVEEELAARKRIIDYHEDYLSQILADESLSKEAREALWNEYYKKQRDYEIEYHKLFVDSIKNSLQQAYDDFEERINKRKEALDFEKEQLSSLSTLLGKHHDILNSIDEEQHNITKELEASKTMTEYLDEETRKLLFNQANYNALNEELVYLKDKANSLQEKYQRDIANATLENISEITSNYERQYDIMLKQYEIAKAELEVAKKRQQLDNVLAEKNVKMLINGRWQWVANTQDVINAQNELADAQYNVTKAQSGLDQTTEQHKLQSMVNSLETTGNEMDAMLERRKNRLDEILKSFEQKPAELSDILAEISASGVTTISEVCGKVSGALGDLYRSLTGKSVNVPSPVSSSGDSNRFTINGTAYNPKTMDLGEDGSITLYYDDNGKLISHGGLNKYASGTKSAAPGLAWIGEGKDGSEFLAKNGHLIPINQPTLANLNGGEMVFNHAQMQNLWKWSDFNPSRLLVKNPQGNIDNSNCNNINIGDLRLDATSGVGKELADVLYRIKNMR